MSLTLFDAIVVVVILISALLAMVRGFVREVLSITSWVIAGVAAYFLYSPLLNVIYPSPIADETIATIIAVAVVFVIVLIIATYITVKAADFVIDSRIGAVDRLMGFVFGALRGLLLVVIAFVFFSWLVPASQQPLWIANAQTHPMLESLGESLIQVLPPDIEAALMEGFRGGEEGTTETPAGASPDAFDQRFTPGTNLDTRALEQLLQPAAPTPGAAPVPAPAP
ncbi:MAG: CvpA family protein [Bauldia sp.]|nr:CvpA family protein [Bauldia sp.]MCW5716639.1 CvpA family protein [Bauldia sp.]